MVFFGVIYINVAVQFVSFDDGDVCMYVYMYMCVCVYVCESVCVSVCGYKLETFI